MSFSVSVVPVPQAQTEVRLQQQMTEEDNYSPHSILLNSSASPNPLPTPCLLKRPDSNPFLFYSSKSSVLKRYFTLSECFFCIIR